MDSGSPTKQPPVVCAENPYEQKLYSMFCGHDTEQRGWLTVDALRELCTTLELKENGTVLIGALSKRCREKKRGNIRVTFKAFKEELLHVLGTDTVQAAKEEEDKEPEILERMSEEDEERGKLSFVLFFGFQGLLWWVSPSQFSGQFNCSRGESQRR